MSEEQSIQSSEDGNQKSKWQGFFIYLILIIISVLTLYPSLYDQSILLIEIYEIEQVNANQLAWLNMIQPFLIALGALFIGHHYSCRVRLRSLIYEKTNEKREIVEDLKKSLMPALILGVILGISAFGFDIVFRPYLPEMLQMPVSMPSFSHALTSILYGGIVEEIMLRWGLMTAAVYVISLKGKYLNKWVYIGSIFFSALIFALGHYSSTATYFDMTPIIWVRMLTLNGLGGLIFGWIYWKHHLEAAILSHMFTHVSITILSILFAAMGI